MSSDLSCSACYWPRLVNVSGSFLLGLLSELTSPAITVLGVGALGAYTTFSTFARDTFALAEQRHLWLAGGCVVASCVLGIGAAALGVAIVP